MGGGRCADDESVKVEDLEREGVSFSKVQSSQEGGLSASGDSDPMGDGSSIRIWYDG